MQPCFEKRRLLADVDKWKTRFLVSACVSTGSHALTFAIVSAYIHYIAVACHGSIEFEAANH